MLRPTRVHLDVLSLLDQNQRINMEPIRGGGYFFLFLIY